MYRNYENKLPFLVSYFEIIFFSFFTFKTITILWKHVTDNSLRHTLTVESYLYYFDRSFFQQLKACSRSRHWVTLLWWSNKASKCLHCYNWHLQLLVTALTTIVTHFRRVDLVFHISKYSCARCTRSVIDKVSDISGITNWFIMTDWWKEGCVSRWYEFLLKIVLVLSAQRINGDW